MRGTRWVLAGLSVVLLTACSSGPVAPTQATPVGALPGGSGTVAIQSEAGAARCYAPSFELTGSPAGPSVFGATLTGDLEGSVAVEFDPSSNTFTGATIRNSGVMRWRITGGVIPGLSAFETAFENTNIATDRPGSPPTVFENIGRHRATSGVTTANLEYKGTFNALASPPVNHRYKGVICP